MAGRQKVLLLLLWTLSLSAVQTESNEFKKVFTQCGLARELFKFGMPKNQLNDCKCSNSPPIVSRYKKSVKSWHALSTKVYLLSASK